MVPIRRQLGRIRNPGLPALNAIHQYTDDENRDAWPLEAFGKHPSARKPSGCIDGRHADDRQSPDVQCD